MWVTNKTTIGFEIPDEHDLMRDFIKSTDLNDWVQSETTQVIYFTKTKTCHIQTSADMKGEADAKIH